MAKYISIKSNKNYEMPVFEGSEKQVNFAIDSWNYIANTFDAIKDELHTAPHDSMINCLKNQTNPQFWIELKKCTLTPNELKFLLNNYLDEFMGGISADDIATVYRPLMKEGKKAKVVQPTLEPITLNLSLPNKIYIVCNGDMKNKVRGLLTNLNNVVPYRFQPIDTGFMYEINDTDEGKTGLEELLRNRLSEIGQLSTVKPIKPVEHDGEIVLINGQITCLIRAEQVYKITKTFATRIMTVLEINNDIIERMEYLENNYDVVVSDEVKNMLNTYKAEHQGDTDNNANRSTNNAESTGSPEQRKEDTEGTEHPQ